MSETHIYDAVSNLASRTDFNGKETIYGYDTLNRLLSKVPDPSLSQPTITFTYTPTGQRLSMLDASGSTTHTYDNRDRVTSKATNAAALNYTYDAHGDELTIASSNSNRASMTYTYDALNRVANVTTTACWRKVPRLRSRRTTTIRLGIFRLSVAAAIQLIGVHQGRRNEALKKERSARSTAMRLFSTAHIAKLGIKDGHHRPATES